MNRWANHINKAYINLAAPPVQIFKLDKTRTVVDSLYNEEKYSRIYLAPFTIRAFHLDNTWRQMLGPLPYTEQEENIQFVLNFEDMVQKIRDLKNKKNAEMYVTYSGSNVVSAENLNNTFKINIDGNPLVSYDLTDTQYNTVQKLGSAIHNLADFSVTLVGINDSSIDLVNFNDTTFQGDTLLAFSVDDTYKNMTDVIELGDLVLSNKWRLYEVISAMPSGDFGWSYVQYTITCNLAKPDQVSLPKDWLQQIVEHSRNLVKIHME